MNFNGLCQANIMLKELNDIKKCLLVFDFKMFKS